MSEPKIFIDIPYIYEEAESRFVSELLPRMLTNKEIDEVFRRICDDLCFIVTEKVHEVFDHHEMLEKNKGAEKQFPHFKLYWRNENAFQKEWIYRNTFKTLRDAKAYIRYDFPDCEDEWKVIRVEENSKNVVHTSHKSYPLL